MEAVVEVGRNDEECAVERSSSSLSSPMSIADPVVYKLVRVEGDGRFVPATEEEVMEVEDFLVDSKSEMQNSAEAENTAECIISEENAAEKHQFENTKEGLSQTQNAESDAEKMTLQVEEKEIVPELERSVKDCCGDFSSNVEECSKPPDGQPESGPSNSAVCNDSKPDFSNLMGEICMDNLSIRELHELFKATFGRDTTVKDKLWLKRRIAMGLTNSCSVSTTTFTIKDYKLVNRRNEESTKAAYSTVPTTNVDSESSPTNHGAGRQIEDHPAVSDEMADPQSVSGKRSNDSVEYTDNEDLRAEQRGAKRVRKPTKRYIEELSESEQKDFSSQKVQHTVNSIGQSSTRFPIGHVTSVSLNERKMLTRLDSLGGSGVQIPCVSRVRRSRPRKNIKALMKFHPSSVGMKVLSVSGSQRNTDFTDKILNSRRSDSEQAEPLFTSEEDRDKCSGVVTVKLGKRLGIKTMDSSDDNSDDGLATVRTPKGGMRRKHHRAWTLVEVMKLVEGVSRCGAGRWSEIKRLAFASYSYRTSVDLKDKWRNLLKASLATSPPDEGMTSRKNAASIPIPASILVRVRELAEMQSQAAPNLGFNSLAGRSATEAPRSGYL